MKPLMGLNCMRIKPTKKKVLKKHVYTRYLHIFDSGQGAITLFPLEQEQKKPGLFQRINNK